MEVAHLSKIPLTIHRTVWCTIPEDSNLLVHTKFSSENSRERDYFEELDVDARIVIKGVSWK